MDIEVLLTADRTELIERWTGVIGRPPPASLSRGVMAKLLICELQWQASGESRAAMVRKYRRLTAALQQEKPIANSGARLVREWNGREHVVDVTMDGYLWNGKTWRSLSAIAREITGTKWSGPRFFGVAA